MVCTHDERATTGYATLAALLPSDRSPTALVVQGLVRVAYAHERGRAWPRVRLAVVTSAAFARRDELRAAALNILGLAPEAPEGPAAAKFLASVRDPAELAYLCVAHLDVVPSELDRLLRTDDGNQVVNLAIGLLKGEFQRMLAMNAGADDPSSGEPSPSQ